MASNGAAPGGGSFSLFPSTNNASTSTRPPSRKATAPHSRTTTPQPRVATPQSSIQHQKTSIEMSPQRTTGRPSISTEDWERGEDVNFILDASTPVAGPSSSKLSTVPSPPPAPRQAPPSVRPATSTSIGSRVASPPPAFYPERGSDAPGPSSHPNPNYGHSIRSSIAKPPLEDPRSSSSAAGTWVEQQEQHQPVRSIFPQYNHDLPPDRQQYFPTETNTAHIPRTIISRQSHVLANQHPDESEAGPQSPPLFSPWSAQSAQQQWPQRPRGNSGTNSQIPQERPATPTVSTNNSLKEYWKAANGWKATPTTGKKYCMELSAERDTPIYRLSSASQQPVYHMRINPTSASAKIELNRHDPSKLCRNDDPRSRSSGSGSGSPTSGLLAALREDKAQSGWHEVLTTILEEDSRRLPPHDGLITLLYPSAAARVALERPDDAQAVEVAERECARLVWDEDSATYFLVHPALVTPFRVAIERNPAWSRVEYILEHNESANHLARLVRKGTGGGWLELDTLVAGRVDSHYLPDVAVCALLIVANADEKKNGLGTAELFEPPPPPPPPAQLRDSRASGRSSSQAMNRDSNGRGSFLGSILGNGSGENSSGGGGKASKNKRSKLEELELDLESQTSSLGKKLDIHERDRDKLPGTTRMVLKLISFGFKCLIWALTLAFKAFVAVIVGLSRCVRSEKL